METRQVISGFRALHRASTSVLAVYLVVALLTDGVMGDFFLLSCVGGLGVAAVLLALDGRPGRRLVVPDSFARDSFFTDMLNVTRVRVSGVGGLGLTLVSLAITFQFPLVRAAVIAGLAGGLAAGLVLIAYRRVHGVLNTSGGPGLRLRHAGA